MREIEVKIIEINIDEIIKKLENMGASKVKEENQVNTIYDFPDLRFKNEKGYARIREVKDNLRNENRVYMTTKKMLSQEKYKQMDEHETEISSALDGHNIFKSLGLIVRNIKVKDRISYKYKNSLIEIDSVNHDEYPFPLLEIETEFEEELIEIVEKLGYKMEDTTSKTMTEILASRP